MISATPFIFQSLMTFVGGWYTDKVRSKGWVRTVTIRKFNTILGLIVPAVTVVLAGYSGCNAFLAITLFTLSVGLVFPKSRDSENFNPGSENCSIPGSRDPVPLPKHYINRPFFNFSDIDEIHQNSSFFEHFENNLSFLGSIQKRKAYNFQRICHGNLAFENF